jgi:hypothetical protein
MTLVGEWVSPAAQTATGLDMWPSRTDVALACSSGMSLALRLRLDNSRTSTPGPVSRRNKSGGYMRLKHAATGPTPPPPPQEPSVQEEGLFSSIFGVAVVGVAVDPALARFGGGSDGMAGFTGVLAGVLVR